YRLSGRKRIQSDTYMDDREQDRLGVQLSHERHGCKLPCVYSRDRRVRGEGPLNSHMLLAVAGGRKTQRIVESIGALPANANALCIGFTLNCQDELRGRLREHNIIATTKVIGWYS